MAIDALLIGRDPAAVDVYENTALMYRVAHAGVLRFTRIDPAIPGDHRKLCKGYLPDVVVMRDPGQKELVLEAVKSGVLHVIFMPSNEPPHTPRKSARQLFRLLPTGEFTPF
ncbi:MAG TPA: hypothetical protein VJK73_01545 [Candidatus Paceibacterota bacterium]